MMRRWSTRLIGVCAVFFLVWLVVVIYWRSTSRFPSEIDLVLYFGVLPLTLIAVAWGLFKLVTQAKAAMTPECSESKDKAQQNADNAGNAPKDVEHERAWTLHIVATSLHTSAGNSSAEVLGRLRADDIEAELDPELKSPEGFAVFSARIQNLDHADTRELFTDWQKTNGHAEMEWSESHYRAMHLASLSVHELAALASEHPDVQLSIRLAEEGRPAKEDAVLLLRMVFLWPDRWSDKHQSAASGWLKSLAGQHGWPERRIVTQEATSGQANALSVLDYINVSAHKAQLPTVGILVACDSGIEQAYIDELAASSHLFGGKNIQGIKPGELSAGLLFADSRQSQKFGDGPFSDLHRVSWANREKSADAKGRVSNDLLIRLTELALETSNVQLASIQLVSSDHNHTPSRESELSEMLSLKFPELDLVEDTVKASHACGSTHHTSATVAALCVAHQFVVDEQSPVLCTSLHSPLLRAAVVLTVARKEHIEDKTANPQFS